MATAPGKAGAAAGDDGDGELARLVAMHRPQLEASKVPPRHWAPLMAKLASGRFDAGATFALTYEEEDEEEEEEGDPASPRRMKAVVVKQEGVRQEDPEAVWLVDHAWTFLCSQNPAKQLARRRPLLQRMAALVGHALPESDSEEFDADVAAATVMRRLWPHANMYRLSGVPGYPADEAIWYIQDEFGSRIGHGPVHERHGGRRGEEEDDGPTLAMVPFYFVPEGCMYSVLWPMRDLAYGEEATRDYLPNERDPYLRRGKLLAFYPDAPLPPVDGEGEGTAPPARPKLAGDDAGPPSAEADTPWERPAAEGRPIRVYTDLVAVQETLTDPRFEVTGESGDEAACDVWWATRHVRSFQAFATEHPSQLVGQMPNQKNLVCKDLLIETCHRDARARERIPLSYNLEYSLHDFIREFQRRAAAAAAAAAAPAVAAATRTEKQEDEEEEEDNVWIIKPWSAGRSLGVVVSDALPHILRLMETGPKVVGKYIARPVTLRGFKFDLRFYLLLRRGGPEPEAYVHRRVVGRMANEPYALADLQNFERHGTVFHYRQDMETRNLLTYPEFVAAFDEEHGTGAFEVARARIHELAADVVRAACHGERGTAVGHFSRARALLGLDVMLERTEQGGGKGMRPLLLEVTYQPDCRRILREHGEFMNEVFRCLVLDEVDEEELVKIL